MSVDILKKIIIKKHCNIYNEIFSDDGKEKLKVESEKELIEKLYNNFRSNKITQYHKNLMKFRMNNLLKLDLSNYLVLIITIFITFFSTYYSHVVSTKFDMIMSNIEKITVATEKLSGEKDMTKPENAKIMEQKSKDIKATENLIEQYKEDISPNNVLFNSMWFIIGIILIVVIVRVILQWNSMCEESFYKLCLEMIEDIETEKQNRKNKLSDFNIRWKLINYNRDTKTKLNIITQDVKSIKRYIGIK